MTNYLTNLTTAELETRLAQIEKMGKETAARLAAGDKGRVVGYHMVKGRQTDTRSVESALNLQRLAWKETKAELNRRA